jgi:hypothetical protein
MQDIDSTVSPVVTRHRDAQLLMCQPREPLQETVVPFPDVISETFHVALFNCFGVSELASNPSHVFLFSHEFTR